MRFDDLATYTALVQPYRAQGKFDCRSYFREPINNDLIGRTSIAQSKANGNPMHDILIIGGGAVGLSLAWELLRRGASVQLVCDSAGHPAASWAGAGILPPAPEFPSEKSSYSGGNENARAALQSSVINQAIRASQDPYLQLCSLSHQLHAIWASDLVRATGIDTGYARCGGLYLATTRGELATLAANTLWWDEHHIAHEQIDTDALIRLEPALAATAGDYVGAWRLADECQIRNPDHLAALRKACLLEGLDLQEDCVAGELIKAGNRVIGARSTSGAEFKASQTVICSGAWSRLAMDSVAAPTGIFPVRGQMLLYKLPAPAFQHVINEGNRYLVCRADGHLLAGSVEEEAGYVVETTDEAIASIRDWAESIMPQLTNAPLKKSWAGLRPGSFDGFPYMGPVASLGGLFLASGHFRSGLHLSPGTAVVMADLLTGKTPAIDLTPFRPGRG
ncbi:MAG TPA: hypothetical protein DDW52_09405 [Planctomycetaceae bacterium]|nr:hypothetical protein [Planctomycetaceae bacterium]